MEETNSQQAVEGRIIVVGGKLEQMFLEPPEETAATWGCRIQFSDGQTVFIPDFCTRREEVQGFLDRLLGKDITADFLPDIVDDYLGEIYGL